MTVLLGRKRKTRESVVKELKRLLGKGRVLVDKADLRSYSYDSSYFSQIHEMLPDVVTFPCTQEEVVKIVRLALDTGTPVTPRGAGTGQTAGSVPARGGIVAVMTSMGRILDLDAQNLQVWVEPGVVHAELNAFLTSHGFFFPPDPGTSRSCTIGGMIGHNSSGPHSVKYGVTSQYVLGMRVVLPDAQAVTFGGVNSAALKSTSGYDMTKLMVGSEGTLGIVTAARLKVLPLPEAKGLVMAVYDDLENAAITVGEVFKAGIIPAAAEILDASAIRAVKAYRPSVDLPLGEAILLFEVDGSPPGVAYEGERLANVAKTLAREVEWTLEPARLKALWDARSLTGSAVSLIKRNGTRVFVGEDIAVPISEVPRTLKTIQELGHKYNISVVSYGHIGDGNVHSAPVIDLSDATERDRVLQLADEIHALALRSRGTTTGEHGIGAARASYMEQEHGPALEAMRAVKRALDPGGIMNPGKMGL